MNESRMGYLVETAWLHEHIRGPARRPLGSRRVSTSVAGDYLCTQYCAPASCRNRSAPAPCRTANVVSMPAWVQVGAETVTDRGACATGQPVRGSRMCV
jgi:hypothetical protein